MRRLKCLSKVVWEVQTENNNEKIIMYWNTLTAESPCVQPAPATWCARGRNVIHALCCCTRQLRMCTKQQTNVKNGKHKTNNIYVRRRTHMENESWARLAQVRNCTENSTHACNEWRHLLYLILSFLIAFVISYNYFVLLKIVSSVFVDKLFMAVFYKIIVFFFFLLLFCVIRWRP